MVKSPCFDRPGLALALQRLLCIDLHWEPTWTVNDGLDGGDMAAKVCRNDGVMDRCRRCVKMI